MIPCTAVNVETTYSTKRVRISRLFSFAEARATPQGLGAVAEPEYLSELAARRVLDMIAFAGKPVHQLTAFVGQSQRQQHQPC